MNFLSRLIKNPSKIITGLLKRTKNLWPDNQYIRLLYRFTMGESLDLRNPLKFTEKIQWLKLYNRRPEYTKMVDKDAVKGYVASKIGEKHIIPTIGIWDTVENIEWEKLPEKFVLKTTHGGGGGGVIVCNKENLNREEIQLKLKKALKGDIYKGYREWPYKNVPHRIIAEKYLSPYPNEELTDYKWYCFNGIPKYCQVIRDRHTQETIDFYDTDWNLMEFVGLNPNVKNGKTPVSKPKNLIEQIRIATELSKNIPFLRVDLYEVNDKVYFGELTFFPASGLGKFTPKEWDIKLGDLIDLKQVN